ncbi:AMP-binding protein [Streptomyces sp. M19]
MCETFGPLLTGVPLVLLGAEDTADPGRLVDRLRAHRVTRLLVVPTLLRILLDDQPDLHRRLPDLRTWISSGEPLDADLAERFHRRLPAAGCSTSTAAPRSPRTPPRPRCGAGRPGDGPDRPGHRRRDHPRADPSGPPAPTLGSATSTSAGPGWPSATTDARGDRRPVRTAARRQSGTALVPHRRRGAPPRRREPGVRRQVGRAGADPGPPGRAGRGGTRAPAAPGIRAAAVVARPTASARPARRVRRGRRRVTAARDLTGFLRGLLPPTPYRPRSTCSRSCR